MRPNYETNAAWAGQNYNTLLISFEGYSSSLYQSCDAHPRVFLSVRACRFIGSRSWPRFIVLPPVLALYACCAKMTEHGVGSGRMSYVVMSWWLTNRRIRAIRYAYRKAIDCRKPSVCDPGVRPYSALYGCRHWIQTGRLIPWGQSR